MIKLYMYIQIYTQDCTSQIFKFDRLVQVAIMFDHFWPTTVAFRTMKCQRTYIPPLYFCSFSWYPCAKARADAIKMHLQGC